MTYRTHQICRLMKIKNRNNKRRTHESGKDVPGADALDYGDNAITALEETLAEHAMREAQRLGQEIEQEPAGWEVGVVDGVVTRRLAPPQVTQPEQEPMLLFQSHRDGFWCVDLTCAKCYSADFRLKHTPPQRTWVGLTDEDYFAVLEKLQNLYHRPPIAIFAKAIEQTLKEKNT